MTNELQLIESACLIALGATEQFLWPLNDVKKVFPYIDGDVLGRALERLTDLGYLQHYYIDHATAEQRSKGIHHVGPVNYAFTLFGMNVAEGLEKQTLEIIAQNDGGASD